MSQKPRGGIYPKGAYHSARSVSASLFSQKSKDERDHVLVTEGSPFLFDLIYHKLKIPSNDLDDGHDSDDNGAGQVPEEDFEDDMELD